MSLSADTLRCHARAARDRLEAPRTIEFDRRLANEQPATEARVNLQKVVEVQDHAAVNPHEAPGIELLFELGDRLIDDNDGAACRVLFGFVVQQVAWSTIQKLT